MALTAANSNEIAFLPDRLNGEPIVFRGLTSSELGALAGVTVAGWLPVNLVLCGYLGYFMMGFGLAGLCTVATVWFASSAVQNLKRGKPDGYHLLKLALLLHDLKLRRSPFIRYTGVWDVRRSRRRAVRSRRVPGLGAQPSTP
jgi:conjugative transfer region protein (TIGR03750 family)